MAALFVRSPEKVAVVDVGAPPVDSPPLVIRNAADVSDIVDAGIDPSDPAARRAARKKTLMVMIIALGGVFVDAYDFTSLGIGAIQLRNEFGLSPFAVGMLTASMAISAMFGAFFGGYFVDKLGRKNMFLLDLWLFVISAIGCALAPNVVVLVFFRLMMGLGVGLDFPVALSFVVEFCQRSRRGLFVNSSYVNWCLAALVGFGASYIGYVLGAGENLWRVAVGFGAVPALILLILRYRYMLESPMWVAHQGDLKAAAEILRRTRNLEVEVCPDAVVEPPHRPKSLVHAARNIFSPHYRPRAVLSAVISCVQSIEYYAVIFYLPIISQMIFGPTLINAIVGGALFNAIGLAGSVFQAKVCDRTGLRPLALGGAVATAVSLLGIAYGHSTGSVALQAVMLGLFMLGHTIGPGPQGMAFAALSFPTPIRGSAVGWAQGMLRVGSITGMLFFPVVLAATGFTATFVILAIAPIVIAAVVLLIRWEPIGRDIEAEPVPSGA